MNPTPVGSRRRGPVARLLDLIDDHITARADSLAREMELEITRIPGTRTHSYRNPVWDLRRACPLCSGTGLDGARPCDPCTGTGVVTLDRPPRDGAHR